MFFSKEKKSLILFAFIPGLLANVANAQPNQVNPQVTNKIVSVTQSSIQAENNAPRGLMSNVPGSNGAKSVVADNTKIKSVATSTPTPTRPSVASVVNTSKVIATKSTVSRTPIQNRQSTPEKAISSGTPKPSAVPPSSRNPGGVMTKPTVASGLSTKKPFSWPGATKKTETVGSAGIGVAKNPSFTLKTTVAPSISKVLKNNQQRSVVGSNDQADQAVRIATADPDKFDSFKDQTLKDELSIGKDDIQKVLKEFKDNAADDIFFRYLARLVMDNYDDDFAFYFREIDAISCKSINFYNIVVAYITDDTELQAKISSCSSKHEHLNYNQLTFKAVYFAFHCWNILCFCGTFWIFQYVFIKPLEEMISVGGMSSSPKKPNRAFKLNSYLY